MPFSCAAPTAAAICRASVTASVVGSRPSRASIEVSVSPSRYSMTTYALPFGSCPKSYTSTNPGWRMSAVIRASLKMRCTIS